MAAKELEITIPLIVRLQGTKENEAKKLIKESGMKVMRYNSEFLVTCQVLTVPLDVDFCVRRT